MNLGIKLMLVLAGMVLTLKMVNAECKLSNPATEEECKACLADSVDLSEQCKANHTWPECSACLTQITAMCLADKHCGQFTDEFCGDANWQAVWCGLVVNP